MRFSIYKNWSRYVLGTAIRFVHVHDVTSHHQHHHQLQERCRIHTPRQETQGEQAAAAAAKRRSKAEGIGQLMVEGTWLGSEVSSYSSVGVGKRKLFHISCVEAII